MSVPETLTIRLSGSVFDVMAEQLYHTLTAENGTHTSWGAAPARTRRAFTHVCEILFRDVRRAIHDYNRGIIRTPEQVGS